MHMVLSNAAIHLNKLRNRVSEDISILAHNAAAMRSVNARMGNDRLNISNEIVGAILGVRQLSGVSSRDFANCLKAHVS